MKFANIFILFNKKIIVFLLLSMISGCGTLSKNRAPSSTCNNFLKTDDSRFYEYIHPSVIEQIEAFKKDELAIVDKPAHATRIKLHLDANGKPIKTGKIAILIHGLFLSPVQMMHQESEAFELGYNVINLRLKGHYEKTKSNLDSVKAEDWLTQIDQAFKLANAIEDQVTLVGHSTGGLLALHLAKQEPQHIDKIILITPALRLSSLRTMEAYLLSKLRIGTSVFSKLFSKRPRSSMAAWEVIRLSKMLDIEDTNLISLLAKEHITIIDLEHDSTIDQQANEDLFHRIYNENPPKTATYIEVPEESGLSHADINFNDRTEAYNTVVEPGIRNALNFETTGRAPNSTKACRHK